MTTTPAKNDPLHKEYEYTYEAFTHINPHLKYPMAASVFFEDNSLTKPKWANDVASALLLLRSNQAMYDIVINNSRCSTFKFIFDIRFLKFLNNPQNSKLISKIYNLLLNIFKSISFKSPKSSQSSGDIQKAINVQNSADYLANSIIEKNIASKAKIIQEKAMYSPKITSELSFKNYQDLFQIIYLPYVANFIQEDRIFASQRVAGANPLVIKRLLKPLEKFPVTDAR